MKVFIVGKYSIKSIESFFKIGESTKSKLRMSKDLTSADIIISFDRAENSLLKDLSKRDSFKVLVRLEPKIVIPENYKPKNIKFFDLLIDVGKVQNLETNVLNWPQDLSLSNNLTLNRSERVAMVNSNLLSLHRGENYSLRRAASTKIDQIDLYGRQWNNSARDKALTSLRELNKIITKPQSLKITGAKYYFRSYQNFLGSIESKRSALSNYKYSLVIENSNDYVSEKIFDSFLAGCIPIYVGPSLTNYSIPTDLYFQAEPNIKSIIERITNAQSVDYYNWFRNSQIWLSSPDTYQTWSRDLFTEKLESVILKNYQ